MEEYEFVTPMHCDACGTTRGNIASYGDRKEGRIGFLCTPCYRIAKAIGPAVHKDPKRVHTVADFFEGKQANDGVHWIALYREIASHFNGDVGAALFDYYEIINQHFFDGALPQAFLLTALTAYGHCIGLTKSDVSHKPIILIHPTLKTEKDRFYVVLHEAIHVYVNYNLGVTSYGSNTSHSNTAWLDEVNRIAKLLGYDVTLGYNKVSRIKKSLGGGTTRMPTGNVSYECSYRFPHALEKETGQMLPPIERWMDVTHNNM